MEGGKDGREGKDKAIETVLLNRYLSVCVCVFQVNEGVMGFVKASQLVETLPETAPAPHEVGSSPTNTHLPTSFVPASKLISASRVAPEVDNAASGPSNVLLRCGKHERKLTESPPTELADEESRHTSVGVGRLRRVKVDPNDLYEDDPSSSEDESQSIPRVSGPGIFGFQMASSLSVSSPQPSQSTVSSDRESRVASSVRSSVAGGSGRGGKGGKLATGHTKPLPKITSFFEK